MLYGVIEVQRYREYNVFNLRHTHIENNHFPALVYIPTELYPHIQSITLT